MVNGEGGPAQALAMSILVRMADVYGASELMDISQAHIDSTIYLGDATLEFAERLASLGARVAVPTSLNVSGVDECGWKDWAVSPEWAAKAARQMLAYEKMGAVPTWTCAPYQTHMRPAFGQQIAWGESNAIAFANSVIGARTERYPDLLDICCAITGRVPAVGLHLSENRGGQMCLRLAGVPLALQQDDQFFAVLGHLVGKLAGERIPVIDGVAVSPAEDQLKAFAAAAASSGRVALFHMVGVTPEAPTLDAAFHGRAPEQTIEITVADLRAARGADHRGRPGARHGDSRQPAFLARRVQPSRAARRRAARASSGEIPHHVEPADEGAGARDRRPRADRGVRRADHARHVHPRVADAAARDQDADDQLGEVRVLRAEPAQHARDVRQPRRLRALGDRRPRGPGRVVVADRMIIGRVIVSGQAEGEALVTHDALSFWGGYDFHTGEIIDKHHPLAGVRAGGRILAVPFSKGSSTTTAVLLEAVRAGTAPAAILTTGTDAFFALASIVADVMYGKSFPVIALEPADFASLRSGEYLQIEPSGVIRRK